MEVFYEVTRIQDDPNPGDDYLRVDGIEQEFNERARIDLQWNVIPTTTNSALISFFMDLKTAIKEVLSTRVAIIQESQRDSLLKKISDNINTDLSGTPNQSRIDAFIAAAYEPPA